MDGLHVRPARYIVIQTAFPTSPDFGFDYPKAPTEGAVHITAALADQSTVKYWAGFRLFSYILLQLDELIAAPNQP